MLVPVILLFLLTALVVLEFAWVVLPGEGKAETVTAPVAAVEPVAA